MSLFYEDKGKGPPLVFLHGFCDTHALWTEFVEPLSKSFRVLTPDLPGFGNSTPLERPFSIDDVGASVADWMDELKISNAIVVGHSLGGYVALSLVAHHREKLSAVCLFHSTPFPDPEERRETRNKVIASVEANGVQPFIKTFVPGLFVNKKHEEVERMYRRAMTTKPEVLIGYAEAMRDRMDRSRELQEVRIPKLVIAGLKDQLIPLAPLEEWASKTTGLAFHLLDDVGHLGIFEAKMECQSVIFRFANSVGGNGRI